MPNSELLNRLPEAASGQGSICAKISTWMLKVFSVGSIRSTPRSNGTEASTTVNLSLRHLAFQRHLKALPAELRIQIYDYILNDHNTYMHGDLTLSVPAPYRRTVQVRNGHANDTEAYFPWVKVPRGPLWSPKFGSHGNDMFLGSGLALALGKELLEDLALRAIETNEVMIEGVFKFARSIFEMNAQGGAGLETISERLDSLKDSIARILHAVPAPNISKAEPPPLEPNKGQLFDDVYLYNTAFWLSRMRHCTLTLHLNGDLLCHLLKHRKDRSDSGTAIASTVSLERPETSISMATYAVQMYMAAIATLFDKSNCLKDLRIVLDLRDMLVAYPGEDYGWVRKHFSTLFSLDRDVAEKWFGPLMEILGVTQVTVRYRGQHFANFGSVQV